MQTNLMQCAAYGLSTDHTPHTASNWSDDSTNIHLYTHTHTLNKDLIAFIEINM